MRFIPNILSDRFIISEEERRMAKKARIKQRNFLEKMQVSYNYQIVGLRYPLEEYGGITLHDALSGIRSRQDPSVSLFFAMEDLGHKVAFLFHRDRSDEALAMIPALPRVLETLVGPNIWPWFDDSAKLACEGYGFDIKKGIFSTDQATFATNFDDWSDDDDSVDIAMEEAPGIDAAYRLFLNSPGAVQWDDSSMKTAKPTGVSDTPARPPNVVFQSSPLSSTTGSTPTKDAILAAAQNDPSLLAELLALANSSTPPAKDAAQEAHEQAQGSDSR
jgi:hypothetical protein